MKTHIIENGGDFGSAIEAEVHAIKKPAAKSKKDQLVALLSKPNGACISVIVERLGWQAHTVRAALSGRRTRLVKSRAVSSKRRY
ncbi:DUF3489 domain-containing protein [Oricola indica]|uniref:DUF3489 domain-containing protein n=1 Tax=Oricola indica TaxID=2872591 RepID=UPI003CCBB9FA